MARLTPDALVPVAAVALAAFAWVASPPPDFGPIDDAADALEAAGVVRLEANGIEIAVDYVRDAAVIDDPQAGVDRRVVEGGRTYDLLVDGTWVELVEAAPVFGQDPAQQLRDLEGRLDDRGRGVYEVRVDGGRILVEIGGDGLPVALVVRSFEGPLGWRVVGVGGSVEVEPPADAEPVDSVEHLVRAERALAAS